MMMHGGVKVSLHSSLTLAPRGVGMKVSLHSSLTLAPNGVGMKVSLHSSLTLAPRGVGMKVSLHSSLTLAPNRVEMKVSLHSSLILAPNGGQDHSQAALPPEKEHSVPNGQEAGPHQNRSGHGDDGQEFNLGRPPHLLRPIFSSAP
jgi:hypothetical protein